MTLLAGTRLGPYEIVAPLGAGGMGEVYRARHIRLEREVAIKVLASALSEDEDRLRRFEREARSASAFNHPNIVTIYDIASEGTMSYISMELVEGKTLRELLLAGSLAPKRLLQISAQIADGLARAHEGGIVHRDLKPENVMVTADGHVKVLDFGLAKLSHPEVDRAGTFAPTITSATEPGTVMGTVGYMSPEQASGETVDYRSDQFSFGSVLYEMATGRRPFEGKTKAEVLAAIIREEPEPLGAVIPRFPAPVRWIIERCLAKEPHSRYASTEDLARDLASVRDHLSDLSDPSEAVAKPKRRNRLIWPLAVAVPAVLATILAAGLLRRSPRPLSPILSSLILPEKMELENLALSPDGRRLAFASLTEGVLWIRALDTPTARPIAVGADAALPFWSPDSRFVAFFSDGKLKKVDAAGKTIQILCDAERGEGGSWGPDGVIVFAPSTSSAIYRISSSGGQPVAVTKLSASPQEAASHRYPFFLPDGRHFLYMASDLTRQDNPSNSIRVGSLDGRLDKSVVPTASNAEYASGYLLYGRGGTLFARPFDVGRLETAGDAVPIATHVGWQRLFHHQFSAAERVLTFAIETSAPSTLVWMDRSGKPGRTLGQPSAFQSPRLSPDGTKVAIPVFDPARNVSDIWIYDAATGVGSRFVLGSPGVSNPGAPVWSPDGERILFTSVGPRTDTLFVKPINGAQEEALLNAADLNFPDDWSTDARFVSFGTLRHGGTKNRELWILSMTGDRKTAPFATEGTTHGSSRFSPDGQWIAYSSDESGTAEVYVRPFPGPGGKWQVSTAGGGSPRWRRDGKELFYLSADNKVIGVPLHFEPTFQTGSAAVLFSLRRDSEFDVSPDGHKFLIQSTSDEEGSRSLTLLVDWTALLKESTTKP